VEGRRAATFFESITLQGMKFPMVVTCPSCKKRLVVEAEGNKPYPNPHCECGAAIYLLQSDSLGDYCRRGSKWLH
jgi:hypothetical protein